MQICGKVDLVQAGETDLGRKEPCKILSLRANRTLGLPSRDNTTRQGKKTLRLGEHKRTGGIWEYKIMGAAVRSKAILKMKGLNS